MRRSGGLGAAFVVSATLLAGCGGGGGSATPSTATTPSTAPTRTHSTTVPSGAGSGALAAEANSAAAGDIPDNQVFLVFSNRSEGYSIKYPEGWARRGSGARVTFRDKNNIVRIAVVKGGAATPASARADMARVARATPSLTSGAPTPANVRAGRAVKVVYSTESAPNDVTGKRVKLVVDRYYIPGPGKHAVVDLGTPEGVDNVDAYRLMSESFTWR